VTAARQQSMSEVAEKLNNLQSEFAETLAAQQHKLANMEQLVGELQEQLSAAEADTATPKVGGSG
jgi:hypothetical protein